MTVWLSGLVFLISCQFAQGAEMADDHCPLSAAKKVEKHCDKGENKDSPAVSFPTGASFDCCGCLTTFYDKARKVEQTERTIAPAAHDTIILNNGPAERFTFSMSADYSPPATYRNRIFIQNRILRI